MKDMRSLSRWGALVLAVATVATAYATHATSSASATSCPASLLRYGSATAPAPSLRGRPWIVARASAPRVVGYLSYYGGALLSDGRVNEEDGAILYTGGRADGLPTRIVWT